MRDLQKLVKATAKALGAKSKDKKPWPIRLSQIVDLPFGPMNMFVVGDLKAGLIPTSKELEMVRAEFNRQDRTLNGKPKTRHSDFFWIPCINVRQLLFEKGILYFVFIGSIENHILPSSKDLKMVRDMFVPEFKYLGLKPKQRFAVFFPPILSAERTFVGKREGIELVLGDRALNILPSKADIKSCREMVALAVKGLGIKDRDIKVVSA